MKAARSVHIETALAVILALAAAVSQPSEVWAAAGGVQDCTVGLTCTIGEYLYDDDSVPINSATCTIVSWDPSDASYLNTSMDGPTQSDGWYSKSFTAPSTTGLYRTTVSCLVSGDTLTIDKSFQVNEAPSTDPNAVATAVWGFSGKTLDSWGTLPQEIWSYSSRTVSSFGSLITDIWNNAARSLTGAGLNSGQLATQDDVVAVRNQVNNLSVNTGDLKTIKGTVEENRILLEKIVNKPIIENVLEDTAPSISEKIKGTRAQANQIYVNNQYLTTQAATLAAKWNNLSGKEALDVVISISGVIGETADPSSANSMFGSANWIKDSWNWEEGNSVYGQLTAVYGQVSELKSGLAEYQKGSNLQALAKQLVKSSLALEKTIGTANDTGGGTLFAKIKTTEALAVSLEQKGSQVDSQLAAYKKSKEVKGISDLQNQVIALNKIPGGTSAITKMSLNDPVSVINNLLSLKGIIGSNLKMLSLGAGKTMVNVWLEVGSIVFKTMATNPSNLISQEVEIKYYLPAEIKNEDIIKTDAGLTVNYDSEKNQLFVAGTFNLTPGQTRTFSIETKDIWEVTNSEIESIRKQADELYKPLEKTAYYAQGVALRSDINASMDQIENLQDNTATPEDKIKAYREAAILKNSAEEKLAGLKDLVTQASAAGSLFGFVGGSQTIAVWGLIIIIAAGFIFMTVYMRTMINKAKMNPGHKQKAEVNENPKPVKPLKRVSGIHPVTFAAVLIASIVLSATASGLFVKNMISKEFEQKLSVLGTASSAAEEPPKLEAEEEIPLIEGEDTDGTGGPFIVRILDVSPGFLRVREAPDGQQVAKVYTDDKLIFVDESEGWYKVQLEDGSEGWVSAEYSVKE